LNDAAAIANAEAIGSLQGLTSPIHVDAFRETSNNADVGYGLAAAAQS
jgi:hypothetical protein